MSPFKKNLGAQVQRNSIKLQAFGQPIYKNRRTYFFCVGRSVS